MEGSEVVEGAQETQPQEETVEYVPLEEASDEDLEAYLDSAAQKDREESKQEAASKPPDKKAAEQTIPADSKPTQTAQQATPKVEPEDQFGQLRQGLERLQKQVQGQELLLQRRTSEIGKLKRARQQLEERIAARRAGIKDFAVDDPERAVTEALAVKEDEGRVRALAEQEALAQHEAVAKQAFSTHFKDAQITVDEMAAVLEQDKANPQWVAEFKTNPFIKAYPGELIQLGKRVQERKVLNTVAAYTKELLSKNKALEEEIAKLKGKPRELAQRISNNLKTAPEITASAGTGSVGEKFAAFDPSSASDAELEEFLKSSK